MTSWICQAGTTEVDQALDAARSVHSSWASLPGSERAGYLFKAADIARRRIYELCAWQILEVGKQWDQAYADVAEVASPAVVNISAAKVIEGEDVTEAILDEADEAQIVIMGATATAMDSPGAPLFGQIRNEDRFGLASRPDEPILFVEVDPATKKAYGVK